MLSFPLAIRLSYTSLYGGQKFQRKQLIFLNVEILFDVNLILLQFIFFWLKDLATQKEPLGHRVANQALIKFIMILKKKRNVKNNYSQNFQL